MERGLLNLANEVRLRDRRQERGDRGQGRSDTMFRFNVFKMIRIRALAYHFHGLPPFEISKLFAVFQEKMLRTGGFWVYCRAICTIDSCKEIILENRLTK